MTGTAYHTRNQSLPVPDPAHHQFLHTCRARAIHGWHVPHSGKALPVGGSCDITFGRKCQHLWDSSQLSTSSSGDRRAKSFPQVLDVILTSTRFWATIDFIRKILIEFDSRSIEENRCLLNAVGEVTEQKKSGNWKQLLVTLCCKSLPTVVVNACMRKENGALFMPYY